MNAKNVVVILAVACAVLLGGLIYRHVQATTKEGQDQTRILNLSNDVVSARKLLDETKNVNVSLNSQLSESQTNAVQLSNSLSTTIKELAGTQGALQKTDAELKAAQADIAKRDAQIAALTTANEELDKQSNQLKGNITSLETAIADTRRKLESSEGDKAVLQSELKRLMDEKADLERQFNDLAVLRTQISKLKEELSIARRLDWIRRGLYGDVKGGQKMLQLSRPAEQASATQTNYDLNVEVKSDGSLKVIPPPDKTLPPPGK